MYFKEAVHLVKPTIKAIDPEDRDKDVLVHTGPSSEQCCIYHINTRYSIKVDGNGLVAYPQQRQDEHCKCTGYTFSSSALFDDIFQIL